MASGPVPLATASDLPCTSAGFAELSAEILRSGRALRFRARGGSMSPLVRDGDVLLVRPAGAGSMRVGDVALCSCEPGRMVAHRVVGKRSGADGTLLTVQGDQVARPDGPIPEAQVYGRVVGIERDGVQLELDRPFARALGRLAVVRSRYSLGHNKRSLLARRFIKRLPVLSRYLA